MPANVIYRGPIAREPQTKNLPVAGAYLPGLFVVENTDEELELADGATGRLLLLSNRRFYAQGPDQAYEEGETAVAYRVEPDQEYTARFAAGTYAKGDPLTINGEGRVAAAGTGAVIAYYDGEGGTLAAGDRDDIVIAFNTAAQGE